MTTKKTTELAADFERPMGPLTPRGFLKNAPLPRSEADVRAAVYYRLLKAWTAWAREHTGPRDENSPHHLLSVTMETLDRPLLQPRLAIIVDGGLIQSVVTNDPGAFAGVQIATVDYDGDDTTVLQNDGSSVTASVTEEHIDRATIELDVLFNRLEGQV